jgi:Tetracyclin repressor-like, C-terminal domain
VSGWFTSVSKRAPNRSHPVTGCLATVLPGRGPQVRQWLGGTDLPIGAVLTFLRCWTLLSGAASMEVFGHMSFALEDPAPMFEITLGDLASLVGLRYPLPQ